MFVSAEPIKTPMPDTSQLYYSLVGRVICREEKKWADVYFALFVFALEALLLLVLKIRL